MHYYYNLSNLFSGKDDDPEIVDIHCTLLHYYSYSIMAQYIFLHA